MTTGQHLVALSGLPSASALAHLLGIQTGSGSGGIVFGGRALVQIESASCVLSSRPAKNQISENEATAVFGTAKHAFSLTRQPSATVHLSKEALTVTHSTTHSTSVITPPDTFHIVKQKTIS